MGDDRDNPPSEAEPLATPARRLPPAAGKGIRKPPPHVMALRVAEITRAIIQGLSRAQILQTVARAQAQEAAQRLKARQAGAVDPIEIAALVPLVWGDNPLPERTLDLYIQRSRLQIAEQAKEISKQKEFVLGTQIHRLNDVYQRSMNDKRYYAALGALREINLMFGLHEALKIMLLGAGGGPVQTEDLSAGPNLKTEAGRTQAFARLAQRAVGADPSLRAIFEKFVGELPEGSAPRESNAN